MTDGPLILPEATRSPETQLTALQVSFCEHFIRWRNQAQAYKHATGRPDMSYQQASAEGGKLMRDARVQALIQHLSKDAFKDTTASVGWLLQRFVDIATADPRELIGLRVGCCRRCYGEGHQYQWKEYEFDEAMRDVDAEIQKAQRLGKSTVDLKYPDIAGGFGFNQTLPPVETCPGCQGEGMERFVPRDTDKLSDQAALLFGGVKVKQNGAYEIIIADRGKAAENVGRIMGAFSETVKHTGAIGALVAIDDMRKMDPVAAAKAYKEMIAGNLAAG